ncbi:MAG: DMT family transporter [Alphaproteobacteria bacterium]|nr:DMT family transporter [Alphaproteobacteria bacterium]
MSKLTSQVVAALLALASFTLWNFSDAGFKLAGESHLPINQIVGITGLFAVLIMFCVSAARGELIKFKPKNKRLVTIRAIIGMGILICNIIAFSHLPLANFYMIAFTTPFVIAIMAMIFLHERLSLANVLVIIVGFIGIVVAVNPADLLAGGGDFIGYLSAFVGVLFFATSQIMLRPMSQTETPECIIFIGRLVLGAVGCSSFVFSFEPVSFYMLLVLFGTALIGVSGDIIMVVAMKKGQASVVAPCQYWQIIPGALIGYFVFSDVPSWSLVCGAAIIIAAGLFFMRSLNLTKQIPSEGQILSEFQGT